MYSIKTGVLFSLFRTYSVQMDLCPAFKRVFFKASECIMDVLHYYLSLYECAASRFSSAACCCLLASLLQLLADCLSPCICIHTPVYCRPYVPPPPPACVRPALCSAAAHTHRHQFVILAQLFNEVFSPLSSTSLH